MSSILVNPKRLKALEIEVEDLRYDLRIAEKELEETVRTLDEADKALIEMWSFVPRDRRQMLLTKNDYIGEMFWNERND